MSNQPPALPYDWNTIKFLINSSYSHDPNPFPTEGQYSNFKLLQTYPSTDGSAKILIVEDTNTQQYLVIPQGTDNIQNAEEDVAINQNNSYQGVVNQAANFIEPYLVNGSNVVVIGHSLGGAEALQFGLALNEDISQDPKLQDGSSLQDYSNNISITTFNSPGLPAADASAFDVLDGITMRKRGQNTY